MPRLACIGPCGSLHSLKALVTIQCRSCCVLVLLPCILADVFLSACQGFNPLARPGLFSSSGPPQKFLVLYHYVFPPLVTYLEKGVSLQRLGRNPQALQCNAAAVSFLLRAFFQGKGVWLCVMTFPSWGRGAYIDIYVAEHSTFLSCSAIPLLLRLPLLYWL